jgi:hypothetical protein
MPYEKRDSDAQRVVIHNQLIAIEHALREHQRKFDKLAQHLVGKPINGEPVDSEGGWCGRMTHRMDEAETHIEAAKDRINLFEERTPTKRGLYTVLVIGTMILGIIQGICVTIVRSAPNAAIVEKVK